MSAQDEEDRGVARSMGDYVKTILRTAVYFPRLIIFSILSAKGT